MGKRKVENISKEEANLQWMAALLSGDYKQVQGTLRRGDNHFCCLGVACDVWANLGGDGNWGDEGNPSWLGPNAKEFWADGTGHHGYLANSVKKWLGLDNEDEQDFIQMNDVEDAKFPQIAKEVERRAFKR